MAPSMSLTICLWASSAFQLWALLPWIKYRYCSRLLCLLTVCSPTLNPSLVFTAGRCHVLFYGHNPRRYFYQISRLLTFFFLPVELVSSLNYCDRLWQREQRCKHMSLWSEMMEWVKYLQWLCRQQRKWMFKGFANWNSAVYEMLQLRGVKAARSLKWASWSLVLK